MYPRTKLNLKYLTISTQKNYFIYHLTKLHLKYKK